MQLFSNRSFAHVPSKQLSGWKAFWLTIGLATSLSGLLLPLKSPAQSSDAPAELKTFLSQMDQAANSQNLQGVLQFYGSNFVHSDGLTRQTLEQALSDLWKRYPKLTYRTELKSWKMEGNRMVAETVTSIAGTQKEGDREWTLTSTLQSRQQLENQKIVRQEILTEHSEIKSGSNPPTVKLTLPEEVRPGQEFTFDAVVQEPLGEDILLGTALEEPIKADGLLKPTTADLEVLSAGGLFKVGRAPNRPENRWISAVLVRQNGITLITQRLRVTGKQ